MAKKTTPVKPALETLNAIRNAPKGHLEGYHVAEALDALADAIGQTNTTVASNKTSITTVNETINETIQQVQAVKAQANALVASPISPINPIVPVTPNSDSFSAITTGDNIQANMTVDTGASLSYVNEGVVNANEAGGINVSGNVPTHPGMLLISQPGNTDAVWADPQVQGLYAAGSSIAHPPVYVAPTTIQPVLVGGSQSGLLEPLTMDAFGNLNVTAPNGFPVDSDAISNLSAVSWTASTATGTILTITNTGWKYSTLTIQVDQTGITGSMGDLGGITFEVSNDNTNWYPTQGVQYLTSYNYTNGPAGPSVTYGTSGVALSTTAPYLVTFQTNVAGWKFIRVQLTQFTGGSNYQSAGTIGYVLQSVSLPAAPVPATTLGGGGVPTNSIQGVPWVNAVVQGVDAAGTATGNVVVTDFGTPQSFYNGGGAWNVNAAITPGIQTNVGTLWNSTTTINTLQYPDGLSGTTGPIGGFPAMLVQLDMTSTFSAGAVTFQGTYDGTNWITIPVAQVLNPQTFASLTNPYTFASAGGQVSFLIIMQGLQNVRLNLTTAITGLTASVTPYWNLLSYLPESVANYVPVYFAATQDNGAVTLNSSSALNTTVVFPLQSAAAYANNSVLITLNQTGTIATGALTFEVSTDGQNWETAPPAINAVTFAAATNPFTLVSNTYTAFQFNTTNWMNLRLRLSTAITGTSTPQVVIGFTSAAISAPATAPVYVTNTPAVTISGTPTVQITGTPSVLAEQSGAWAVSVTGDAAVNIAQYLGSAVSKTNPIVTTVSDGTNVLTAALSAWGTAPTGTFVQGVNAELFAKNVALSSTGAALNVSFGNLPSIIQKSSASASGTATDVISFTPTVGNTIIVTACSDNSTLANAVLSVSDGTNTYVLDASTNVLSGGVYTWSGIFRATNVTGSNLTITATGGSGTGNVAMTAYELSGGIQVVDVTASGTSVAGSTSVATSTAIPHNVNEFAFLAVAATGTHNTVTAGTGWTLQYNPTSIISMTFGSLTQLFNTTIGSSITGTATLSSSGSWAATMVVYQSLPVNVAGYISVVSPADGATGGTVPNDAAFMGVGVNGNLQGLTGLTPGSSQTGTIYAANVDITSIGGNAVGSSHPMPVSATTAANTKTNPLFVNLTDSTNSLSAAISAWGTAPTGTDVLGVNSNILGVGYQTITYIGGFTVQQPSGVTTRTIAYQPNTGNMVIVSAEFASTVSAVTCVDNNGNSLTANANNAFSGFGTAYMFYGVAQPGATSYTLTWTTSSQMSMAIVEYSGVGQISVSQSVAHGSSTSPTLTTAINPTGALFVTAIGFAANTTVTQTAGTQRQEIGGAAGAIISVSDTPVSSGTCSATLGTSESWLMLSFVLLPAATLNVTLIQQQPVNVGGIYNSSAPAASGQTELQVDSSGSLFINRRRSQAAVGNGTFTSATPATLLAAQSAGIFADLGSICITVGEGATANVFFSVNVSDGTSTYKFNCWSSDAVSAASSAPINMTFEPPIPATNAATAWTVALSSATDTPTVNVTATFVLQKAS